MDKNIDRKITALVRAGRLDEAGEYMSLRNACNEYRDHSESDYRDE